MPHIEDCDDDENERGAEEVEQDATPATCTQYEQHICDDMYCTTHHGSLPYLWRLRRGKIWKIIEDSRGIEEAFCNPNCSSYDVVLESVKIRIDFDAMTNGADDVERLSTPSYVISRDTVNATKWQWYWQDSGGQSQNWVAYEDDEPPYQDVLEAKYCHDRKLNCFFDVVSCSKRYKIDFMTMKQTNRETGFERNIRRRPVFLPNGIQPASICFHFDPSKLPVDKQWVPMNTDLEHLADLIPANENDSNWCFVYSKFHTTMPEANFTIRSIYRIQSLDLWSNYEEQRMKMGKRHSNASVELQLFHGTVDAEVARCICHQNFDRRLYGTNVGTVHGKGVYFATTAKFSHSYTRLIANTRWMFLARVLVGKSAPSNSSYSRPPPLDPNRPFGDLYDSCVDNIANPAIYVVFDNAQCYPEFLIEYGDGPKKTTASSSAHPTAQTRSATTVITTAPAKTKVGVTASASAATSTPVAPPNNAVKTPNDAKKVTPNGRSTKAKRKGKCAVS